MNDEVAVVKLPANLRLLESPEGVNRRLRRGLARLDWSGVREVPDFALALLLEGLDPGDEADVLGIETVPEGISSAVLAVLEDGGDGGSAAPEAADATGVGEARGPVLSPPSASKIRDELEGIVVGDLLGPAGGPEEEVAERRVSERYLVGMLAPRRLMLAPEEFDEFAVAGKGTPEEGTAETSVPQAPTMFPSSFGMSFSVSGDAEALRVTARWGRYRRTRSRTLEKADGNLAPVWKREPIEGTLVVPLAEGEIPEAAPSAEQPEVVVRGVVRRPGGDPGGDGSGSGPGDRIVTLFLVNGQAEPKEKRDEAWIFQPELVAESPDGSPVFTRRPSLRDPGRMDPATYAEESQMAMVYRREVGFAVGHNVSVRAEKDPEDPRRALSVSTSVLPSHDVPKTTPPSSEEIPALKGLVLDMKELSETPDHELPTKLSALPAAYEAWIEEQRNKLSDPGEGLVEHEAAAREALRGCERAHARIREGISLLAKDEEAAEAFRFANRAMWLQRTRSIHAESVRRGEKPDLEKADVPKNRTWYPFQLAFVLLNLPGLTDPRHPERSDESSAVADLLWFPTGGGKTEAYLGLAAYAMGLRRLQGTVAGRSGESGVAVLMRYTLRLLTLQQFQRASALVCACEAIRREAIEAGDARWGAEPFRIGLWVGQRATPNRTKDAEEAVKKDLGAEGWNQADLGTHIRRPTFSQ